MKEEPVSLGKEMMIVCIMPVYVIFLVANVPSPAGKVCVLFLPADCARSVSPPAGP